jgi:hypothetical protein
MGLWDGLKPNEIGDARPTAPDAYTNSQWQAQSQLYREMWRYFNREIFDDAVSSSRANVKKYPLGINLFEQACVNHRAALFGEFETDALKFRITSPKATNLDVEHVEAAVDQIWVESGRNSIFLEGGLITEILGGVVYRVMRNPARKRVYVRLLQPDAFFPVWDPDDYHDIMECYVAYMIDAATAFRKYHVRLDDSKNTTVQVWEHWTRDWFEITVDGKLAYWDRGHRFPMAGSNPYTDPRTGLKIIPFEYFPRDRAGSFYGIPLGKNMLQLQNEYNLRQADLGDATMEASHQYLFKRNAPQANGLKRPKHGELNELGTSGAGQDKPDVFAVKAGEAPEASVKHAGSIKGDARSAAYTPPVAYGEDEGSQRSALTLAFRMWPLTQSVRTTRGYWTDSFYRLHRKIIIVASVPGDKYGYNLTPRHAEYRFVPAWSPMIPRDREGLVNEIVARKSGGLISVHRAIELLEERETEFIEEEVKRIEADQKREADLLAQQSMMGQPQQQQKKSKVPDK